MTQTLRHKRLKKNLGKSRTMREAMLKSDYSQNYADNPQQLRETQGGKEIMEPIERKLEKERDAILDAMSLKDKNSEEYKVLCDALDKVQKQIQIISGKATERIEVNPIYGGKSIQRHDSDKENLPADQEN